MLTNSNINRMYLPVTEKVNLTNSNINSQYIPATEKVNAYRLKYKLPNIYRSPNQINTYRSKYKLIFTYFKTRIYI